MTLDTEFLPLLSTVLRVPVTAEFEATCSKTGDHIFEGDVVQCDGHGRYAHIECLGG
jgi:hypothetical protein